MPQPSSKKRAGRTVRKTLADGSVKVYRYPVHKPRAVPAADTMRALLRAYEASPDFAALAKATRAQYLIYLRPWLKVAEARPRLAASFLPHLRPLATAPSPIPLPAARPPNAQATVAAR